MNDLAQSHLAKAKEYIAQGDEFYRQAKEHIDAALASGASLREVSRFLDRSKDWVANVRDWDGYGTLYGKDTERRQIDMAKQVLRESPPEQIADMLNDTRISRNVTAGALLHEERTADRVQREQRERAPELVNSAAIADVVTSLSNAHTSLIWAVRKIQKTDLSVQDREDLLQHVLRMRLALDYTESFLTEGTRSIDSELAELLEAS